MCRLNQVLGAEMSRKGAISYGPSLGPSGKERSLAEVSLATSTDCRQFYCLNECKEGQENTWTLISQLDRSILLAAGDKGAAKEWAKLICLKSWTYVHV